MEFKKTNEPFVYHSTDQFRPAKAIFVIVGFLLIIGFVWFLFLNLGSSKTPKAGNLDLSEVKGVKQNETTMKDSFYRNYIKLSFDQSIKETYPEKEYIQFYVQQGNLSAVDISDWQLMNSKGEKATIGEGTELFTEGKVNKEAPIILTGGDSVIVSTGRSPKGISFRQNLCTGYFEQFQDFFPPLELNCPMVTGKIDIDCQQIVYGIKPCISQTKSFPPETSTECKSFIIKNANYNGCVTTNKDRSRFFSNEWRVFLGRDQEMWAPTKDTITLLDNKGFVVDMVKY